MQETENDGVFIITDKSKGSRGGGKRCRCYHRKDEELKFEEGLDATLLSDDVRYTIVNGSQRIC